MAPELDQTATPSRAKSASPLCPEVSALSTQLVIFVVGSVDTELFYVDPCSVSDPHNIDWILSLITCREVYILSKSSYRGLIDLPETGSATNHSASAALLQKLLLNEWPGGRDSVPAVNSLFIQIEIFFVKWLYTSKYLANLYNLQ